MTRRAAGIRHPIRSEAPRLPRRSAARQAPGAGPPSRTQPRWPWDRVFGLVVGFSLFLAVASALSPVETDIAVYS